MFGEVVAGMMLLVMVAYTIACFIIYHKIFKVYYFGSHIDYCNAYVTQ